MHQMRKKVPCSMCKKPITEPLRRKYCSTGCYLRTYQKKHPAINLTCKVCSTNIPSGSQRRKYCSNICYLKKQSLDLSVLRQSQKRETHDCSCCVPPKQIPKTSKYCPENAWMGRLTPSDRAFAKDGGVEL